jgi:hypothetical protein
MKPLRCIARGIRRSNWYRSFSTAGGRVIFAAMVYLDAQTSFTALYPNYL